MRQARQRQSQVCGVHGRGLSGFGQQVHLWPLSIPDPAVRLISPGRRVFRRVTRCHRPWPGCRAPTNPPRRRARPSRSRIASPRYAPAVGPAGHGCVAEEERSLGTLPSGRLGQQHLTTVTSGGTGRAAEFASEAAHVPKARSLSPPRPWPAASRHGRLQVRIRLDKGGQEFRLTFAALHALQVRRRGGSGSAPGRPGPQPARALALPEVRQACLADAGPAPPAPRR